MWLPSAGGLRGSSAERILFSWARSMGRIPGDVVPAPDLVLLEFGPQPLALDEIGVAPEGDELVQRAKLRCPRALERAVFLASRGTPHLRVELEILALRSRDQRVGA
jgi:hypothetical protein